MSHEVEDGMGFAGLAPEPGEKPLFNKTAPPADTRNAGLLKVAERFAKAFEGLSYTLEGEVTDGSLDEFYTRMEDMRTEVHGALVAAALAAMPVPSQFHKDNADSMFLNWIADRFVNAHGESPNVDFVLKLRELAAAYPTPSTRDEALEEAAKVCDELQVRTRGSGNHNATQRGFAYENAAAAIRALKSAPPENGEE